MKNIEVIRASHRSFNIFISEEERKSQMHWSILLHSICERDRSRADAEIQSEGLFDFRRGIQTA